MFYLQVITKAVVLSHSVTRDQIMRHRLAIVGVLGFNRAPQLGICVYSHVS